MTKILSNLNILIEQNLHKYGRLVLHRVRAAATTAILSKFRIQPTYLLVASCHQQRQRLLYHIPHADNNNGFSYSYEPPVATPQAE